MSDTYESSANKDLIRREWDRYILARWREKIQHPLTYFGLPGPKIHDFIDWGEYLGNRLVGVEDLGTGPVKREIAEDIVTRMSDNVGSAGLQRSFALLRGSIEDIIINGKDAHDIKPPTGTSDGWDYDLVNLDFVGGIAYRRDVGDARRIEAIKKLFRRQRRKSFVLFVTVSVRHTLGQEIEKYLSELRSQTTENEDRSIIDWATREAKGKSTSKNMDRKLKLIVPTLIRIAGEIEMFDVWAYPPISYIGKSNSAHMLHFAFALSSQQGVLRAFSKQSESILIGLPLLKAEEGKLRFDPSQPQTDSEIYDQVLDFLPESNRRQLLETLS